MQWRVGVSALANATTPVLSVVLFFSFVVAEFQLAWFCALVMIVCAEARVQVGERLTRTTLFWTHLLSAIPFFLGLTTLAFWAHPLWLEAATGTVGLIAFGTGAVLWYRGLEARMLHLPA